MHAFALGCAYFAAAAFSVRFTRFEGGVAFIWCAGALLLGALVVSEKQRWIELIAACTVASFAATWLFGLGHAAAAPLSAVNMTEAFIGAWLLRRFCPACDDLKSAGEIGILLLTGGIIAPGITAFVGAGIAALVANVPYWPNWTAWYAGHALGTVILGPLVLLTMNGEVLGWVREASSRQRIEAVVQIAFLAVVTAGVFAQTSLPLLFLPFLPMMILVFRFGRLGAAASSIVLSAVGTVYTVRGYGPIALIQNGSGFKALFFQLYLATGVLMVLPAAGDLKRRKRDMQELEEQSVLHRLILDRTSDVIMTLELDGRIRFASPAAERVLGISPAHLVGSMPQTLIHPDDVERVAGVHREVLATPNQTFTVEYRVVVGNHELGWFETNAGATLDGDGVPSGAVVVIRNVTHRKEAEQLLAAAAMLDPLTGIANRRAFEVALARRLAKHATPGPAALALFDLDYFKAVNDSYGHAAGDQVLCRFAEILRGGVRSSDLVARLGGEEFVALVEGDIESAQAVCDRVRSGLAAEQIVIDENNTVRVTVSAGVAALSHQNSISRVLAAADAALYRAKAEGRNRLVLAA